MGVREPVTCFKERCFKIKMFQALKLKWVVMVLFTIKEWINMAATKFFKRLFKVVEFLLVSESARDSVVIALRFLF